MGYIVEQFKKGNTEELKDKLYDIKMMVCELLEEFEDDEEMKRDYRMSRRMNRRGRYDY